MFRNYFLDIIGYSIALIMGIWIGYLIFSKKNVDFHEDKVKFETVTIKLNDSVKKVEKSIFDKHVSINKLISKADKIRSITDTIVIEKPVFNECNELYEKSSVKITLLEDNISIKDSIISVQDDIILDKDNIISLKDEIIKMDREYTSILESKLQKVKPKFIIGPSIGYGVVIQDKPVIKPYVGVSLTLNIF